VRKIRLCFASLLLVASPAWAEPRRVALVEADQQLEHAVAVALSPWGVSASVATGPTPGTELPGAARRAAALARRLRVDVVVWVTATDRGSVLWMYDLDTDEVSTRELGESPPFSDPAAASVALSLKTLLRATTVAPSTERFGVAPPVERAPHAGRLTLAAGGDLRFLASDTNEVRASVDGVWWFQPAPTRLGLGLGFAAGPGVSIVHQDFSGQFRQLSLSGALTWQVVGNRWLASSLFAGGSAHFSELSGFSQSVGDGVVARRITPTIDAGTHVEVTPGAGINLGLGVRALYLPRYQRYLVRGEAVFELWPIAAEFGVRLGVNLL
jgi:hypothetical protein